MPRDYLELKDPLDLHRYRLGVLWSGFHSLEVFLRLAVSGGAVVVPRNAAVGDVVDPDDLNRWTYLPTLVEEYNRIVSGSRPDLILNRGDELVRLRNALAHGIVYGEEPGGPLTLLKFGKPVLGTRGVPVEYLAQMTYEWLTRQRDLIFDAMERVITYLHLTKAALGDPIRRPSHPTVR